MKSPVYQRRFYRDWVDAPGLKLNQLALRETDLQILSDKQPDLDFVKERLRLYRWQIEHYIARDSRFLSSLKPIAVERSSPAIVRRMSEAARIANVGPMAAVAGAIAEFVGKDLLAKGLSEVIIENGGDIFLKTKRIRRVQIYPGRKKPWQNLKVKVRPKDTPLGVCASSGTMGHSLSFGAADAVVILAHNTALADAVATACANRIQGADDLPAAMAFARSFKAVEAAVFLCEDNLVSWGRVEFAG
jgi:ApbE superfamily uncharacterized protein (UPF0280 family)